MKIVKNVLPIFFVVVTACTSTVVYAQQAPLSQAQANSETATYSLEKLCKKSGRIVMWLGSLNNTKRLTLKGTSVGNALKTLCASQEASYSYDDDRFIFRKLDFVEQFPRTDFGTDTTNTAYRVLVVAPDEALRLMPDNYEKEARGETQEGAPLSSFNGEGRVFAQKIVLSSFRDASTVSPSTDGGTTYSLTANLYRNLTWKNGDASFSMGDWRSTEPGCRPEQEIAWSATETEAEKFDGTLDTAIRQFGPEDATIDPRLKNAPVHLFYPKGTPKAKIFAQMKNDIPFKLRELEGKFHAFSEGRDVAAFRTLMVADKLYNSAGACGYDMWEAFAYRGNPIPISDMTAKQKSFVKNFIENHNTTFTDASDKIPVQLNDGLPSNVTVSFVPQIAIDILKKDAHKDNSDIIIQELTLEPTD